MAKKERPTKSERYRQKHQFDDLAAQLEATPVEYRAKLYEKLERERIAKSLEKSGKKRRGGWPFVSGSFESGGKK
ncbi:hypothetical protein PSCICO_31780 [Pseudomonas cichorii]|uniref:hypothetical protein n=1 Tax=Pseudomonas cichorii TaxID=36746 RepID=UPI0019106289|nr:hypothetical protein [Pseudomonas cichorii]GFM87779.1 hypothetical protein PSCICO_31780 [Pseudomonas cichorii]